LIARLSEDVKRATPNKLITLTVNPAFHETPRAAYDSTRRKLPDFVKAMRKEAVEFEYMKVLEVTAAGWPHYHFVARSKYIPKALISSTWGTMTGATIVDIRALKPNSNVYAYVTKYLGKQTYIPWTKRRISWSRGFFPPSPEHIKAEWQLNNRQFHSEHPCQVVEQRYWHRELHRVGPYAWMLAPIQKSSQGAGPLAGPLT